jgi:hypothetical protein
MDNVKSKKFRDSLSPQRDQMQIEHFDKNVLVSVRSGAYDPVATRQGLTYSTRIVLSLREIRRLIKYLTKIHNRMAETGIE